MTLQELLFQEFKVKTRANVNPETTALTGNVDKVLSNNPNRLAWTIINLGSNPAYLSLSNDPASDKGILLGALGGSASMIWNEDFDTTGWELFCKGESGDDLYVVEILTTE